MQSKLSKLQRWILEQTARAPNTILPTVRIMGDYFGLPLRERPTRLHETIVVVKQSAVNLKVYNKASISMNRSISRLKERGLIKNVSQQRAITLTESGVILVKELLSGRKKNAPAPPLSFYKN